MTQKKRISTQLKELSEVTKQLLYPVRCPRCDRPVIPAGKRICRSCRGGFVYVKEPRCCRCGKELSSQEAEYCYDCLNKHHEYDKGMALYEYSSVWQAVFRFKYQGRQEYAGYFGEDIAEHLGARIKALQCDALVPVPLHPARLAKRGYNQSELLAREIGRRLMIPVNTTLVARGRNTRPQKELDDIGRQNNLKKAFNIVENDVKLNTIMIIDDIYTTGSTIDAIALALRNAGIRKIYYVALAIGKGF